MSPKLTVVLSLIAVSLTGATVAAPLSYDGTNTAAFAAGGNNPSDGSYTPFGTSDLPAQTQPTSRFLPIAGANAPLAAPDYRLVVDVSPISNAAPALPDLLTNGKADAKKPPEGFRIGEGTAVAIASVGVGTASFSPASTDRPHPPPPTATEVPNASRPIEWDTFAPAQYDIFDTPEFAAAVALLSGLFALLLIMRRPWARGYRVTAADAD